MKCMNMRKRRQMSLLTNIVLCIVALASLTVCIFLLLKNYQLNYEVSDALAQAAQLEEETKGYLYTQSDVDALVDEAVQEAQNAELDALLADIRKCMEDGKNTSSLLRELYPEETVVYAEGRYHFFPIEESYQKNDYVLDNFVVDEATARIDYVNDLGEIRSKTGIDVSKHQGRIDWEKVAGDGIDFAFIRVGYRGSSEGKLVEDEYFLDNIEGALENGIDVGVYFYTQAVSTEEAKEEARFLLDLLEPYEITYPVVLDLEEVDGKSRTDGMTQADYTDAALAFLETVESAGYKPMIYGNLKTFFLMLDLSRIEEYEKWFAYYQAPVYFPYEFSIWQYSSTGTVNGIKGDVDMNVCMEDY